MRQYKFLYYPYQLYKYLVYMPLLVASTIFCGTFAALLAIFVGPRTGSFMGIVWSRFNCLVTPMPVRVFGKENIDPKRSYILAVNHQSQFDIFVMYGFFPQDFRWVMKAELRKVPFLGYSCYKIGHIFIDRKNTQAALEQINAAKKRITGGTSVIFFPEGTRSYSGELGEFKKGAFKFALDMGLPVLPVTIIGTRNVLPNNSIDLFPGRAVMAIHKPIETAGYHDANIQELMDLTKASIQKGLDEYGKK
ncbi:MAG: 1-acyl-sn-glycerol-3-phosphate acyltransferase [Spirochaetes bacterium]|nr:MAG: 1-acyl-sn-glycerol-3-phosphate acyltransferase [Spirochaetota bacterium]